jgi:hypothetical protein
MALSQGSLQYQKGEPRKAKPSFRTPSLGPRGLGHNAEIPSLIGASAKPGMPKKLGEGPHREGSVAADNNTWRFSQDATETSGSGCGFIGHKLQDKRRRRPKPEARSPR